MSSEGFARFLRAVNVDADLADALVRTTAENGGTADSAVLAAFAQSRGYDVRSEDIEGHRAAGHDGELSEMALDGVAGGIPVWVRDWKKNNP